MKLTPENWKRGIAGVILWAYFYQLVAWPLLFWLTTLLTMWTGKQWPAPPVQPWEQLLAGTTLLGTVGGIETWRESRRAAAELARTNQGQSQ
jgi:ABC-type nickel/cobalt efflux system permease component RcnA